MAMTKKEFKERTSIHVYGRGERRRVRLYFDWRETDNGVGFSKMLNGYGVTQAQILADAYDILIKNIYSELCWYDYKEAETDAERFKVSLVG